MSRLNRLVLPGLDTYEPEKERRSVRLQGRLRIELLGDRGGILGRNSGCSTQLLDELGVTLA